MSGELQSDWVSSSGRVRELLDVCSRRIVRECAFPAALEGRPMTADPWIVSSALQKAIRRSEADIAQRAAVAMFALRGSSIWRRFMVIAFEDIGIASVDALVTTVAVGSHASWRSGCGGDERVAAYLARMLAEAPKDRATDYLASAKEHPAFASFAQSMATASAETSLSTVRDKALDLPHRAVAAYFASGLDGEAGPRGKVGFDALLASFRADEVPEDLIAATETAARRTREPITVMVPLIWLAARPMEQLNISEQRVPDTELVAGVPLYAFDKHTRLGKRAIREFIRTESELRSCLQEFVPEPRRQAAAEMAAFYADAAPIARRLEWPLSRSVEAVGTEADFAKVGVPLDAIKPLQAAMAASLGQLNQIRKALWLKASASVAASG